MKNLIILLSALVLFAGCAKNRDNDTLKKDQIVDWQAKSFLTGTGEERDLFYAKVTVVANSLDGGFVFSGMQSDMKVGYFDFTKEKLMFKSIQGPYKGRETTAVTAPVLFQWEVDHKAVQLAESDGKITNKEIEDVNLDWWQKPKYVAKFGAPEITEEDVLVGDQSDCWPVAGRRFLEDTLQAEDGYFSFVMEVVYKRQCGSTYEPFANGFNTYTVRYRYSFMRKPTTSNYKPFAYEGELDPKMRKFGYFQSVMEELNPVDGRPRNTFFVNRWAPGNHVFYFSKETPDQYKYIFKDIFDKTNAITGKYGVTFEIKEHDADGIVREFGDLRYAFVNIVDSIDPSAPLGYGPSDADPFTGEIISASLNIWSSSLKDYIRRIKISSDRVPAKWTESNLYVKMKEALETDAPPTEWATLWNSQDDLPKFYQRMIKETTYGYPGYNMYAKTDGITVPVEVYADKPSKNSKSGVVSNFVLNPKAEVTVHDQEWLEQLLSFKTTPVMSIPQKILNYHPMEESPLFKALTQLHGNAPGGVPSLEVMEKFTSEIRKYEENTMKTISKNVRGHCAIDMDEALSGLQNLIVQGFTADQIAENIMYRTAIHEFGHNLNLRHNFYGSIDQENFPEETVPMKTADADGNLIDVVIDGKTQMWPAVSSSVMDYLRLQDDFFTEQNWEPYDVAALKYAYSGGKDDSDGRLFLYCSDEHSATGALCNKFDRGFTPSQIVMSIIDAYEDAYYTRNYRDGRAFWNTGAYFSGVLSTMQGLKEFYPMWRAAFYESNMREQLKKMGYKKDASEQTITEMNREIKNAVKLSLAFYQAVIQQSAADKPYRSEFDLGTGALQRIGIADDKLIAMFFMAGDDALYYNPNRVLLNNSYMTFMYDADLAGMMEKILENIVTQRVDMEPWFIGFGRQLYAQSAMDYSNRDDQSMIRKIKVKKYTAFEIEQYFGYDLNDIENASVSAKTITLPISKDADFKKGEEVAIVLANSNYFVFSKSQNPFAYDIYKGIKVAEENQDPATEGQLDLQSLNYIYNFFTTGTL